MMHEKMAPCAAPYRSAQIPMTLESNADNGETTFWLLCRVGSILCALPLEHVIETMRILPLERIAGAPAFVRGLSIIRGAPVPVVDVALVVGDEVTPSLRLVVIRMAARTVALAVDSVVGITALAPVMFDALPPLLQEAAAGTIGAIGMRDSDFLVVLRSGRLVPEDVLALLDGAGVPS
jgi:purine-binding chemotaxis protein CheW